MFEVLNGVDAGAIANLGIAFRTVWTWGKARRAGG
jgi:hypothetical protein